MKSAKQQTEWKGIENTTIGAALRDLERYADASIDDKAQKVYDAFVNSVPGEIGASVVAIAALRFERTAMAGHGNVMAEQDAEIRATGRLSAAQRRAA
jgi:hypothetical protein